ncbi:triple tyrosine motif-containing protein [Paraflavitalea sp. CAU 1676]|uniref:triple tyrosine motif-containing protein n=1 Tax=Paraflavitalea sp. CAU 1676 TaxID=3032598 RepID=UPI0023DA2832|nr:triple tyrosine motif-containing protein [Paraflavitalea sp. CAU 1676]MDF2187339.1 triple tyrosine motif-containing protein [Paraflavitalea sp. CAU 1676]
MRKVISLILIYCYCQQATAQNTIGIPTIINYTRQAYNAGNQNWSIGQDKNGLLYFANNKGLLVFDGTTWRTYPLPGGTIVRSLAIGDNNRIYVGGQGEFGYFSPAKNGELTFTSLKKLVPPNDNDFADVWNICIWDQRVFFRSNKRIFELEGNSITVHKSIDWAFMARTPSGLVAFDFTQKLVAYNRGEWQPVIKVGALPKDVRLTTVLALGKDSILLCTLNHGLYLLKNDTVSFFDAPGIRNIIGKNIHNACQLSPDRIALVTNIVGCIIINRKGEFVQRFSKKEGLQSNNILSVKMDRDKNLWLGLDNGIDLVAYSNSIKNIFPDGEDRNAGYTSMIFKGQLYCGLSTGLYKVTLNPGEKDYSYSNNAFEFVPRSEGQVWGLSEVNDQLLVAHNRGAYQIENGNIKVIDDKTGFWIFKPLYNTIPSTVIIAGTYNGVNLYNYSNGTFQNPITNAVFESARYMAINHDTIWIAHPYKGLYKVAFNAQGKPFSINYQDKAGILSANHNHLYQFMDRMVLTSDHGIFEYDPHQKDFVRSAQLEKLFGSVPSYIKEDRFGNLWFCNDKRVSIVDRSGPQSEIIHISEIDDKVMRSGFEHINVVDSNNVFIAAEKGFFHLNYAQYKKNKHLLQARIRLVRTGIGSDSLIFGGYTIDSSSKEEPIVSYANNSLHFESASNVFGQEENTEYSYWLEGFDRDWSPWNKKTEKDYTNLPEGNYTFKVKCRSAAGSESAVAAWSFRILPPWYRTWWAFILYALLFFGVLYLFYKRQQEKYQKLQQLKLQEQQRKYDEEQKQLQIQHELEMGKSEKEIMRLQNEKLEAELEHKNAELASSAMSLVRKMEILTKLKEDLVVYKNGAGADKGSKDFQKIMRVLDKELDHDGEWEQFANHFDTVHTNYLRKLKEVCPEITASELKLAAYLRLSLSTKEIAQLMNISIRGVETSRYRLRKKLGIANEVNLYDYLINVTQ